MAITLGTVTNFDGGTVITSSPSTKSVTVDATANGLYVNIASDAQVTSLTYNGVALTRLWSKQDGAAVFWSSGWILAGPATGANNMVFTASGVTALTASVVPLIGLAQGNTAGTSWRTLPTAVNDGGSGSATASIVVSTALNGDLILDGLSVFNQTPAKDASQTTIRIGSNGGSEHYGSSSFSATGSKTMQWTMTSTFWAYGAVALIPQPTVTFLESGTDATQDLTFWPNTFTDASGTITSDSTQSHVGSRSLKIATTVQGNAAVAWPTDGTTRDAGTLISAWVRFSTVSMAQTTAFMTTTGAGNSNEVFAVGIGSDGKLRIKGDSTTEVSGTTVLSANTWYRISLSYVLTTTSNFTAKIYLNGTLEATTTQAQGTLGSSATSVFYIGIASSVYSTSNGPCSIWFDSVYVDNRTDLTDCGAIDITAKRPFSNGTTNGFTTQIGVGGSGYGSGHAPQVNEQPLSQTNGWSILVAGSAITEEYNIEGVSVGDVNLTGATIQGVRGWIFAKSSLTEADSIIVDNTITALSVTSTAALFTQNSNTPTTYPAGTGTDIGMKTNTTAATASLYEAGVLVAYIAGNTPVTSTPGNTKQFLMLMGLGT